MSSDTKHGPSRTLMLDIAQRSGVSISTVSRVINGRPDVSLQTREKVLHHAQELGYMTGCVSASTPEAKPSTYIGVIVPRMAHVMDILTGIAEGLKLHNARLVVCPTDYQYEQELMLLEQFIQGPERGLIMVLPAIGDTELITLQQRHYPFVVIDPIHQLSERIPSVTDTNMLGARQATEHLVSLGHRRIGVITGFANWCASVDRLAGYHAVLMAARLPYDAELVQEGDFTIEGGYRAAQCLLDQHEPPTAIFAFNDEMAIGALHAIQEHDLRVPEDLSVIGFGETGTGAVHYSSMIIPNLTTVRRLTEELGRMAVDMLYRIFDDIPQANHVELSTQLIVRASTGPVPTH